MSSARQSEHAYCSGALCFTLCLCVLRMRSKAWLDLRVPFRQARLSYTANSVQRSRRLRPTRAAAPVLLALADVSKIIKHLLMGPTRMHPPVLYQYTLLHHTHDKVMKEHVLIQ